MVPTPATFIFPALEQIGDVAQRRIRRALLDSRPLRRRKLAFEAVQQTIQHIALTLVECIGRVLLPEARLLQHAGKNAFRPVNDSSKAIKRPL
jgi:hypothetical protein